MNQTSPDRRTTDQSGPASPAPVRWPLWIALVVIAAVWIGGCVWSFEEQSALARSKAFHLPELLPLVIDGFAIAMAAVAWAASLDGRAAVFARTGTAVAVACSAGSNAAWAWERSAGDKLTVILAASVPVVANVAFEVLLSEARRQVQRRRGVPAPVPIPYPRLVRVIWSPLSTLVEWRQLVLEVTDPKRQFAAVRTVPPPPPEASPVPAVGPQPEPVRTAEDEPPARSATVTPINRATKRSNRKTGPGRGKQTNPPGPAAIRDAETLLDQYQDRLDEIPSRNGLMKETGWGAERASNALNALPVVQSARESKTQPDGGESADDTQENDRELVSAG